MISSLIVAASIVFGVKIAGAQEDATVPESGLALADSGMSTRNKVNLAVEPFALGDVQLLGGPWLAAHKADVAYLLTIDPDRLLHSFRVHAGLKPKAPMYGGWEDSGLAGHTLGHYLTACAQEFATSKDTRYKARVDAIVDDLVLCQAQSPTGYLSATPNGEEAWKAIHEGHIRSGGFDLNGMWSPWYVVHKIMAGLLDAYTLAGNKKALGVCEKMADWSIYETAGLSDTQWQQMLGCEYGGMNDALAELYSIDGQEKYLDLSRKFYDNRVLNPLADGHDDLAGKHSNTQIPKIIGLARLYELTGDEKDKTTTEFFWNAVAEHHSYVIGGNGDHEYLGPPDKLSSHLSSNTCETCCTYNMLKLTRHLFEWDPKVEYADFYERAHLNDILASQDPDDGMMCYFVPLASGSFRQHSTPFEDFTCCVGTGMENHTKHTDSAYFHAGASRLYVVQFMDTELNWREAGVKLTQSTAFPQNGKVAITIEKGGRGPFEMLIRHPGWAGPFSIALNGKVVAKSDDPGFASIKRRWKAGDRLEFTLPMELHMEPMPDNPNRVALLYGPVVLAADMGDSNAPAPRTPVLVTDNAPVSRWLQPVAGEPLQFTTQGCARPVQLTLKPFYEIDQDRYAVYFDLFSENEWQQQEDAYRKEEARIKDLESRTIDYFRVGEMQPERDHDLVAVKTDLRDADGHSFRTPLPQGHFEFKMKVDPSKTNDLVITYWGNPRWSEGVTPDFRVLIDGQPLSEETLPDRKPNVFFDVTYRLDPAKLTGKQSVIVRIESIEGKPAGSISAARITHE